MLLKLQLSLAYCRGQCKDGASSMPEHKTDVAKTIQDVQREAHPTQTPLPLTAMDIHASRLSVKDTVKNCKLPLNTMDTAKRSRNLVQFSPKQEDLLGDITGKSSLSPTRWAV